MDAASSRTPGSTLYAILYIIPSGVFSFSGTHSSFSGAHSSPGLVILSRIRPVYQRFFHSIPALLIIGFSSMAGGCQVLSTFPSMQRPAEVSSIDHALPGHTVFDTLATSGSNRPLAHMPDENPLKSADVTGDSPEQSTQKRLDTTLQASIDIRDLPLSELLAALAQESGIDIIAGDLLEQPVTLRLVNQSLRDTMDILATQLDAAWRYQHGAIHIFSDRSVTQTYPVNYLNIARHTASSVGLATRVGSFTLTTDAQSDSNTQSNNSETRIENESKHDFWSSLAQDLEVIGDASSDADFSILVNREAGLVTVIGHHAVQRNVRQYLDTLQQSISRQVLIEATVVEVSLTDEHRTGVDWRIFDRGSGDVQSNGIAGLQSLHGQQIPADENVAQAIPSALFSFQHRSSVLGDLSVTLEALRNYGSVHILSQPQIIALNNQSAVLKVVDNRVYFSVGVERSSFDNSERVTTESRIHTVPVGLVMSVIPFIAADGQVVLNIRPSISRILGFREDPIPTDGVNGIRNSVPEIQVREMESVLSVRHGETIVIGGLMQQNDSLRDTGVRGLRSLPWIGQLFGREVKSAGKSELLVFLRPTVIKRPV